MTSVFKVLPTAQQYDWGKIGSQSRVAQLASASNLQGFSLDETKPYAEAMISCFSCDDLVTNPFVAFSSSGWGPIQPHLRMFRFLQALRL